ncbi:hypothetical protein LTR56_026145 [Elasticomyces elasticus]|nr:hypothetical protein LTR56_026145 [Elasticomyces elasticus]KAK3665432.1 hypothetical protein LTR22_003662 [Elasticomyces elasticus]KAK4929924.1 hypothetical protein LTR49_003551 [Elasticomyces elasticus]KAK5769266.1 hypothetical protein LTS12_000617 [Elasticomyces elasticus]
MPSSQASRDETLNRFYERGIGARHWEVFHEADPIRIVYVGDSTANLHQLVQAEQPANRLHFPFPAIKPLLPWKPDANQTTAGGYLIGAVAQDLASFPTRVVRDALISTYFEDIHPCYPVIDEEEFRRQYRDPDDPPPLILFHAVLLAAARISDHPMIAPSRPTVTATLFRRAKALFEARYENDRVHLVQAALLIAWHVEDSDTISSNAYHWIGQATRIALGLGMHRDLTGRSTTLMPGFDRRHYRRLWWLVLQAETMTALEYGRPSMIRAEDYDQPPLTQSDLLNFDGSPDTIACIEYVLLNSELCEIALAVLALNAPRSHSDDSTNDLKTAKTATSLMRANAAHGQLERLLRPVEELAKYWPHVEALSKLCISLFSRGTAMLSDATVPLLGAQPPSDLTHAEISWQDIMAGYQLPDLRHGLDTEEWMYSL